MTAYRRQSAFSLMDLLVAIGIVVVVTAIMIPVLARTREHARAAQCLAHLQSQARSISIYTVENTGHLPPCDLVTTIRSGRQARRFYDQILEETVQSIQPRDYEKLSWLDSNAAGPVGIFTCPSVAKTLPNKALVYIAPDRTDTEAVADSPQDAGPQKTVRRYVINATSGANHFEVNDYLLAQHEYRSKAPVRITRPDPVHPSRADTNLQIDLVANPAQRLMAKDVKVWRSGGGRRGVAPFLSLFGLDAMHNDPLTNGVQQSGLELRAVVVHPSGMNHLFVDGHASLQEARLNHWMKGEDISQSRYGRMVMGATSASVVKARQP